MGLSAALETEGLDRLKAPSGHSNTTSSELPFFALQSIAAGPETSFG